MIPCIIFAAQARSDGYGLHSGCQKIFLWKNFVLSNSVVFPWTSLVLYFFLLNFAGISLSHFLKQISQVDFWSMNHWLARQLCWLMASNFQMVWEWVRMAPLWSLQRLVVPGACFRQLLQCLNLDWILYSGILLYLDVVAVSFFDLWVIKFPDL
jgi:hypothetical protein